MMFGKKEDPLENMIRLEGERWIDIFTIQPLGSGRQGDMIITNKRIICFIYNSGNYHDILHNDIISFKWTGDRISLIMSGGHQFSILYTYVNDFGSQYFKTIIFNSERKKKQITEILSKYPYYDKPFEIKKSDRMEGGRTRDKLTNNQNLQSELNDPLKILKTRYAKGEITKEEYDEMKKDLE